MPISSLNTLRQDIRALTHASESQCVEALLQTMKTSKGKLSKSKRQNILTQGQKWVEACREQSHKAGMLDAFLQEFNLSSSEGVALMCLAESLLRIPDSATADALIAEKIRSGQWHTHLGQSESLFVNASTWGLMLTGRIVELDSTITEQPQHWYQGLISRAGETMVRTAMYQAMKIMGQQYVLGRTIDEAIKRGPKENPPGTLFSFDMLGEGARTMDDADHYFNAYREAIHCIGEANSAASVHKSNGISIKLSALHPRYSYSQKSRVEKELLPRVMELAIAARSAGIGMSIDAEEADRLELSLDIFEQLARSPALAGWQGLGFVLQAYGKRAPRVIDWLDALATDCQQRFMVRLVKGAYWDTEIKHAQEQGYADYPVYTRKQNTDLSYQVCAEKLFNTNGRLYPQFATHNAHTVATILALAEDDDEANVDKTRKAFEFQGNEERTGKAFEFQRLHGMGDLLYAQLNDSNIPIRVYAPVGAHQDLLPYLVRRLLENGANSSFVNRLLDKTLPAEQLVTDIQTTVEDNETHRHPAIPLPKNIFHNAGETRTNTHGIDLTNPLEINTLLNKVDALKNKLEQHPWHGGPVVDGIIKTHHLNNKNNNNSQKLTSPADNYRVLGQNNNATPDDVDTALTLAHQAYKTWNACGINARATVLENAAHILEKDMERFVALLALEAGRTLEDGITEVREAADFLRYYAMQACLLEAKENSSVQGRGVFFCISPWNFPLAIFIGQISAALVTGNTVIAKPAENTPMIATEAIALLHQAGVPTNTLHLLPGNGSLIGETLNLDPRVCGIAFTGSTGVALKIQESLSKRPGTKKASEQEVLIAETGGQNCMIVDSSALIEQAVDDAIRSAFLSAGQRCSALRVMYVQEEIAERVIEMLKGAMAELTLGMPWDPSSDIGPIIDEKARNRLQQHIENFKQTHIIHSPCKLPSECEQGSFFAPQLIELESINELDTEIFGPILHVIRFRKLELTYILNEINDCGYGLTLGIHSRIESFAKQVIQNTRVGNNYVNRNMVGAVVGVNPFGGQGLSGTGPKAGGPHYLSRFIQSKNMTNSQDQEKPTNEELVAAMSHLEKASDEENQYKTPSHKDDFIELANHIQFMWDALGFKARANILEKASTLFLHENFKFTSISSTCQTLTNLARTYYSDDINLPGPTGETNILSWHGRGIFYAQADDSVNFEFFVKQWIACLLAGNAIFIYVNKELEKAVQRAVQLCYAAGIPEDILTLITTTEKREKILSSKKLKGVSYCGTLGAAKLLQKQLQTQCPDHGILPFIIAEDKTNPISDYLVEKTTTVNIVATGGNTQLLNLN